MGSFVPPMASLGATAAPTAVPTALGVPEELAEVGRAVISKRVEEDRLLSGPDLAAALRDGAREPYSAPRQPWPPLLRERAASELPARVLERLASAPPEEVVQCACGVFPDIRRAWVTVDNTLYLWRFDARGAERCAPVEYSEEQVICAVALAPPAPGVFIQAVKRLLVLATPVEIVLLGVCTTGGADGLEELALQPLPLYAIPSDTVAMRCVTATAAGRIFMGGHDGHLYELVYTAGTRWRERRVRKVCHSATLSSYLPSFMTLSAPDPIVEIAVDEPRGILYTRSVASGLVVYDLGEAGDRCAKVAECADARHAARLSRSTKLLGLQPLSGAASEEVQLATTTTDGTRVFWTVLQRSYGTVAGAAASTKARRPSCLRFVASREAPPPPRASSTGTGGAFDSVGGDLARGVGSGAIQVQCAMLTEAEAIFAGPAPGGQARLMVAARDWTLGQQAGAAARQQRARGLRELIAEVPAASAVLGVSRVPASEETATLVEPLAARGAVGGATGASTVAAAAARAAALPELVSQHALPRRQVVVVTQTGVRLFERMRPIDTLAALLEAGDMAGVRAFFGDYGQAEACAMCLALAGGAGARVASAGARATVAARAADAWCDVGLVGTARVLEGGEGLATPAAGANGAAASALAAFNMGQAVRGPELVFSGAYEGACLYAARVLRAVWEVPLAIAPPGGDALSLACPLARAPLAAIEGEFVSPLAARLAARITQSVGGSGGPIRRARRMASAAQVSSAADASAEEASRLASLAALLARAAEALRLLQLLPSRNFARLALRLSDTKRAALQSTTFGELVSTKDGQELACSLAEAYLKETADDQPGSGGDMFHAANALRAACPQFFGEAERVGARAMSLLGAAAAAKRGGAEGEASERAAHAIELLRAAPLSRAIGSACAALEQLGEYEGLVELALRRADAVAAQLLAAAGEAPTSPLGGGAPFHGAAAAGAAGAGGAAECYALVTDALERLAWGADRGGEDGEAAVAGKRRRLLAAALRRGGAGGVLAPRAFYDAVYAAMLRAGMRAELLSLDETLRGTGAQAMYLDAFLLDTGGGAARLHAVARPLEASAEQASHLEALARLYAARGRPGDAAWVLHRLAFRSGGDGVGLEERCALLSQALLHARSVSVGPLGGGGAQGAVDPAAAAQEIEDRLQVLTFQQRLARELCDGDTRARAEALGLRLDALNSEPMPVSDLYNNFATPMGMQGIRLDMLAFSRAGSAHVDDARELWDDALAAAAEQGGASGAGAAAAAAEAAAELAAALWIPVSKGAGAEVALPLPHIVLRIESIAAGMWPPNAAWRDAPAAVVAPAAEPLVAALRSRPGGVAALHGAYEALLSQRGGALAAPELRLRVLRGAADCLAAWRAAAPAGNSAAGSGGAGTWLAQPRQTESHARVAHLAEGYAIEARSLTPADAADAVAARLTHIARG